MPPPPRPASSRSGGAANSGGTPSSASGLRSKEADKQPGTFFLGRYRVVDEIGVGGMASVHLGRMDGPGGFQKWVAIKRIHPHLVEDDQFVDVASRLRTQRESVARVRVLLDKATTIGQVVQVESELTRRQADLESLEARLAALSEQSTLATLTVSLSPVQAAATTKVAPGAFVEGLRGGWQAMLASVAVALRVLGALLPFGVLAALVGLPVMVLLRRRRTQPTV